MYLPTGRKESTWLERFTRKIQEQYLAVEIEKKINNKNVILENYLNTINLGAGTYGVQAAARKYFNKDVWDLNLSESARLWRVLHRTRHSTIRLSIRRQMPRDVKKSWII